MNHQLFNMPADLFSAYMTQSLSLQWFTAIAATVVMFWIFSAEYFYSKDTSHPCR
tara:strand:- start:515 stop:679 length:165 start_codon:yes stop_codon:yes gene_type:complete